MPKPHIPHGYVANVGYVEIPHPYVANVTDVEIPHSLHEDVTCNMAMLEM